MAAPPLLLLICCIAAVAAGESGGGDIAPDDPRLVATGTVAEAMDGGLRVFHRYTEAVLATTAATLRAEHARTTSGVALHLRLAGGGAVLRFNARPGINRGLEFGLLRAGSPPVHIACPRGATTADVRIPAVVEAVEWTVALPSWADAALAAVQLDAGCQLLPPPAPRAGRYIAVGDSISHGTGQGSATHRTWPFLLAERLGLELLNLGVGGSMTTPAVAALAGGRPAALISVLYGFNDWNRERDPARFRERYRQLLAGLRTAQPAARIACITPLTSTRPPGGQPGGADLAAFRTIVREEAAAAGGQVVVLAGEELTAAADLADGVHLSVAGAARFAAALAHQLGEAP